MKHKQEEPRKDFPGQHEGERVELVFHRHPIVMRKQLIIGMLLILLGTVPALLWPLQAWPWRLMAAVPLFVVFYWFYHWLSWYYSVYIITSGRFIEIKQKGLFNRSVTEYDLDKIQSINYAINGLNAVLFRYGDIVVQTYIGEMVMSTIYKPVSVHESLVDIVRRFNSSTPKQH